MNFFEFKQLLDDDVTSQYIDFLRAKKTDKRCRQAFHAAMAKEQVLIDALHVPVPDHNIEHIKFHQAQSKQSRWRQNFMAVAASAVLAVGVGFFIMSQNSESDLEKFIHEALVMEPAIYMGSDELPQDTLEPLFANINTAIDGDLGDVHFMKLCPTLNGQGARMVVMNELNQPITVLYMPNSPVEDAISMQMDGFKGKIVALEQGSAAIIARPHESTAQVEANLLNAIRPLN